MSSDTPFTPTFSYGSYHHPPPTSTPYNNAGDQGPSLASSAALYLYTFLATLLLLLAISCTVIVRALVVRRRRQEAIRNGTWPPSNATGIAARWGLAPPGGLNSLTDKVDLSNPPKLWEVYLNSERPHSVEPTKGGKSISSAWRGDERTYLCWDIILPFSASLKQLDENKRLGATPSNDSSRRRRDEAITNPFSFLARFANALNHNHPHSNTGATQEGGSRSGSMIPSDPNTAPIGNRDAGTHTLQMSSLTSAVGPPSTSTPTTAGATTNATASKTPQKWRNTKPFATQKDANANSESVDEAIPVSMVVMIAMPRLPKAKQGAGMSEVRIDAPSPLPDPSTHTNPPEESAIDKEVGGNSNQPIFLPHVEVGIAEVVVHPTEVDVDRSHVQDGETADNSREG